MVVTTVLLFAVPTVNAAPGGVEFLHSKKADSYAKNACKEWSKVPGLPTTQAQLTKWMSAASSANKKAIKFASSAAKRDKKWDVFLVHFIILRSELNYLRAYRQFNNAQAWDSAVTYLKTTCYKLVAK